MHPSKKKIYKLFGYVKNSIYIINKLINNNDLDYKTVYLSDFEALEVKNWGDLISQEIHRRKVKEIPTSILRIFANIGDILKIIGYKNPPLTTFRLNNLLTDMIYDI